MTETERQRIEAHRWDVVADIVGGVWAEQQADRIQYGLIDRYVQAIYRKAAWANYRHRRGEWFLEQPDAHEQLKLWAQKPEKDRGPEPGPLRPASPEPDDRDLPVLTPDQYGRQYIAEDDAMIYLAATRIRAGLPIEPKYAEVARARYPWARHSREVA